MSSEKNPLSAYSEYLVQAVEKASKSTVQVNGRNRMPASGIAFRQDLILTADHVIERDEDLRVVLSDGETISAVIAGRDPGNDLAVLSIEKSIATPAETVMQEAKVGELVLALGRPRLDGIHASHGIICAVGGPVRTGQGGLLDRYFLTDATPFPGFSGGPLINTEGGVLGLNTSGLTHGSALTIPAPLAWMVAENLAKHGYVKRGYLGIRSQTVSLSTEIQKALGREQESGLLLVSVEPNSPAELGGLIVGDIMVGIDGNKMPDHDELMVHLTSQVVGKPVSIQIIRGGHPQTNTITIGERK